MVGALLFCDPSNTLFVGSFQVGVEWNFDPLDYASIKNQFSVAFRRWRLEVRGKSLIGGGWSLEVAGKPFVGGGWRLEVRGKSLIGGGWSLEVAGKQW